VKAEKYN